MKCLVINIPSNNLEKPSFSFNIGSKDVRFSDNIFKLSVDSNSDGVISSKCNNKLASVDSNGTVTFNATGTCIITATVQETGKYQSATASYTLNICTYLANDEINLDSIDLRNKMLTTYNAENTATSYDCTIGGEVWNQYEMGFKVVDAIKLRGKSVRFIGTPRSYTGYISFYSPLNISPSEVKSEIRNDAVLNAFFESVDEINNSRYRKESEIEETHDIVIPNSEKVLSVLFNASVESTFKLIALENII